MRNERIVVSRQRLLDEVWGYDPFSMTNTIEVFVSNLRRKLESGGEPRLLHTIRGAGYVLALIPGPEPLASALAAALTGAYPHESGGGRGNRDVVIRCVFAVAIGSLTVHRIRSDLNREVDRERADFSALRTSRRVHLGDIGSVGSTPDRASSIPPTDMPLIRISQKDIAWSPSPRSRRPWFAIAPSRPIGTLHDTAGYARGKSDRDRGQPYGTATLLIRRALSEWRPPFAEVQMFLLLGVSVAPFLRPARGLSIGARDATDRRADHDRGEIDRTRDPTRQIPHPAPRTRSPSSPEPSRGCSGSSTPPAARPGDPHRQREFVADASHELRTPLTSVLANLELLDEKLDGDRPRPREAALRSSRRMRRLVGDLLLLARSDALCGRRGARGTSARCWSRRPGDRVRSPTATSCRSTPSRRSSTGSRRTSPLVINLLENAVRHTPPGTRSARAPQHGGAARSLVVEDDGPGSRRSWRGRVFERFVRGGRRSWPSFGPRAWRSCSAVASPTAARSRCRAAQWTGKRRPIRRGGSRGRRSDLDDHRQDHRPPPKRS